MYRILIIVCLASFASCECHGALPETMDRQDAAVRPIDFDRSIRPLLANACYKCHGPDASQRQADLRLDREASAKEHVIVPGDARASELARRITSHDPDERMPPPDQKQQLTENQIESLRQWIDSGALWSQHWSYVPPKREPVPTVQQKSWPQGTIDHFILARMEEQNLSPSHSAKREALLRRVTLDLTGLPPTLTEVDAFLADRSPQAYEQVVDRLLASPRYGEQMALPWLAAARYADTNGYQSDRTRSMWPWRDWVIRSLNENMPFDRFTLYQLAGDQFPNPTADQMIATGFHRNHPLNGEGGRNAEQSRVEYVVDRVNTTGTVWLGLTVGCARCHDHKYDDLSQQEFYRLYAYFNSIDESGGVDAGGNAKPVFSLPTKQQLRELQRLQQQVHEIEQSLSAEPAISAAEQQVWEEQTQHWLERTDQGTLWEPLQALRLESEHRSRYQQLPDHSVWVRELEDMADDYLVTAELPNGTYHALRIEALRHPQLVGGGFSMGVTGGFSVTGLKIEFNGTPVRLVAPQANIGREQDIAGLLDTSRFTSWSVSTPQQAPTVPKWMARFEQPLEGSSGSQLTVRMQHQSWTGEAPIGRFRIALTQYSEPTLQPSLGLPRQVAEALRISMDQRTAGTKNALAQHFAKLQQAPLRDALEKLQAQIAEHEASYLKTMVMRDRKTPRDTFRLERGLWNQPDKSTPLHPGVPNCLPPLPPDAPRNRLTLARWLVRPDHPLTARVTVNRQWQLFFGTGLVKTSEDFGVQGQRPSHPKLLDWLATEFVQSGWDVKQLHKLIVMSATYQQATQASAEALRRDPANRLLSHAPRFRLSAQTLRDQALALSGLLVEKQGGPGVMPYQPENVWTDFSLGKIKYAQGKGDDLYRRSIYTFWRRPVGPTLFFDNPGRQVCTVSPALTNTPLHALTLLNDVTYVEAARVLAERVLGEAGDTPQQRIGRAFRMATSRRATTGEIALLEQTWRELVIHFRDDPQAAAELVAVGESGHDPHLDVVELAAYTSLMNALLNLDEVVNKG